MIPNSEIVSDHDKAILSARARLAERPLFLDTETTALDGEVCEIAVVDFDGVVLFDSLIKPRREIQEAARQAHGITEKMVEGAPRFEDVWERLKRVLLGRTVLVYNVKFDRERLLTSARLPDGRPILPLHDDVAVVVKKDVGGKPATLPDWRCAMLLYATFHGERSANGPEYKWQKLGVAFERECANGADLLKGAHRARADAEMCRQVVMAMARGVTAAEAAVAPADFVG